MFMLLKKIVFTDIDGTLTDIFSGEYGEVDRLIPVLKTNNVPVVLCSAKTYAEQNKIRESEVPLFTKHVEEVGMKVIYGARFFDVTAGNDKGKAVSILLNLFRRKYHNQLTSFGIGDS